jgi:hypothetical protein
MNAPATIDADAQPLLPVVDILKILAASGAASWALFPLELADVIDPLQAFAEQTSLVHAIGQDAVQDILADAFAPYRIIEFSALEEIPLVPEQPPRPAKRPYSTADSTIAAFWFVVSLEDPAHLKAWLADHSRDASYLLELLDGK